MPVQQETLGPGQYYHIFNKTVGGDKLFKNNGNYDFFLEKFKKHVAPYTEILAYCLMPTHFHFLLKPIEVQESKPCEGFKPLTGFFEGYQKKL